MLRARDAQSGLRTSKTQALGKRAGLLLEEDNAMPANNRLLVFRRS